MPATIRRSTVVVGIAAVTVLATYVVVSAAGSVTHGFVAYYAAWILWAAAVAAMWTAVRSSAAHPPNQRAGYRS